MNLSLTSPSPATPVADLTLRLRTGSPVLWRASLALLLGVAICLVLMAIDHRQFNGINVWDKPIKFFLSLAVQLASVSFAMSFLPPAQRAARSLHYAVWAMVAAAWLEALYICYRAALAEASHFNNATLGGQVLYGLMGLGAVTLTLTGMLAGFRVWGQRGQGLVAEATGLGLVIGMALGTAAGAYLSAQGGHWVGGEFSDAHGLGVLSWSTTGGDLRVPHFVGLHAAQGIPLAAITGARAVVYGVALVFIAATAFTFLQAVMGIPLFRA